MYISDHVHCNRKQRDTRRIHKRPVAHLQERRGVISWSWGFRLWNGDDFEMSHIASSICSLNDAEVPLL